MLLFSMCSVVTSVPDFLFVCVCVSPDVLRIFIIHNVFGGFVCCVLGCCVFLFFAWVLCVFCLLVCFVLILSRYVFTPFVLLLSHELHLSDDCVIILVYFPFSMLCCVCSG